jgi:6-phosphogluconolactonase
MIQKENIWQSQIMSFDERRNLALPGSSFNTLRFCVDQFISLANDSIDKHGYFSVALSGGSTPKAIYKALANPKNRSSVDWSRFLVFWSDERCVPPTDPESNYRMAMEAGLRSLPIPHENIFRMVAEENWEENAKKYEELIKSKIEGAAFDLVMLGVGDDGHTASLFPETHGLHTLGHLVIANFISQKDTWRMTLTFDCINSAHHTAIYVMGKSKAEMLNIVLNGPYHPDQYPVQKIGLPERKALWIADQEAARLLTLQA